MSKSAFANEFMARIQGKVSDDELNTILTELSVYLNNWDVKKSCTDLTVYNGVPKIYKTFMVTKKIEGRSEGTLNLYQICLEDMFARIAKPIEDITTNDIRVYLYMIKQERDISDRTLDHRRIIINGFFAWCADNGYINCNPCATISPIRYEEKPRQPFTDVEMELLRSACLTLREKAIIEMFYSTGCRCSELSNLKKNDINFETREVSLFGKGKKHRTSYINARTEVALKQYFETRDDDEPYVFVCERKPHRQLTKSGIENILHNIGERANIKNVFPHRIRHTFATDALNHGMPITDLQRLMGHESIDTTMIYSKISKETMKAHHKMYII